MAVTTKLAFANIGLTVLRLDYFGFVTKMVGPENVEISTYPPQTDRSASELRTGN